MGSRLNIEIVENGTVLANAYYHWSSKTLPSLEITQEIIDIIGKVSYENRIINAIKLLEVAYAGLTDEEKEYINKTIENIDEYTFNPCIDRNNGLIAVSPEGIKTTELWEDKRVIIDLTTKTVNFGSVWHYTKENYEKEYEEDNGKKCDLKFHDLNFEAIAFDDFSNVNKLIHNFIESDIDAVQVSDNKVIAFII